PDHLHAQSDPLRSAVSLDRDFSTLDRLNLVALDVQHAAEGMIRRENFPRAAPAQFLRPATQKLFHRRAHQHGPAIRAEKQQPVLEPAHHLIEIFSKRAEYLAHIPQLAADAHDFRADRAQFALALDGGLDVEFPRRYPVELRRNPLDWREC